MEGFSNPFNATSRLIVAANDVMWDVQATEGRKAQKMLDSYLDYVLSPMEVLHDRRFSHLSGDSRRGSAWSLTTTVSYRSDIT